MQPLLFEDSPYYQLCQANDFVVDRFTPTDIARL